MQQPYEKEVNATFIDLLEILYWRVFGMGKFEVCEENHVNKNEVLALLEDTCEALKGK